MHCISFLLSAESFHYSESMTCLVSRAMFVVLKTTQWKACEESCLRMEGHRFTLDKNVDCGDLLLIGRRSGSAIVVDAVSRNFGKFRQFASCKHR